MVSFLVSGSYLLQAFRLPWSRENPSRTLLARPGPGVVGGQAGGPELLALEQWGLLPAGKAAPAVFVQEKQMEGGT